MIQIRGMDYIGIIKKLDYQISQRRLGIIIEWLNANSITYWTHAYSTGTNLIVDIGSGPWVGVSSHFDRVDTTAGANDNASAIVVCLDLILRLKSSNQNRVGVRLFFFDEEETGLKGSSAYVADFGTMDLIGLMNLEMVGRGEMVALWPLDNEKKTPVLDTFEQVAIRDRTPAKRFDKIVTNTADHVPFIRSGLKDSFSITCVSKEDLSVAEKYFLALSQGKDIDDLHKILATAPLFQHYHKPTDTYEKIESKALIRTADLIERTIELFSKSK